jgi:hypothetical protein
MNWPRYAIEASVAPDDLVTMMSTSPARTPLTLTKRAEFFLEELLAAGSEGITTISYPGVRVGDAIHKLRKAGVVIDTTYEEHGGEFAGNHGRYILQSRIVPLRADTASEATATATAANEGQQVAP